MMCPKTGNICKGQCHVRQRAESDPQWYAPTSLEELAALYTANPNSKIKLLTGDTGRGIILRIQYHIAGHIGVKPFVDW